MAAHHLALKPFITHPTWRVAIFLYCAGDTSNVFLNTLEKCSALGYPME